MAKDKVCVSIGILQFIGTVDYIKRRLPPCNPVSENWYKMENGWMFLEDSSFEFKDELYMTVGGFSLYFVIVFVKAFLTVLYS